MSAPALQGARVVVIGAGLAGLYAASQLRQQGCDVVLLERRPVVGGRVGGAEIDGFAFDSGLALVSTTDAHLMRFAHEVGASDRMLPLRPVQLAQVYNGRVAPVAPRSVLGLARMEGVRPLDALRVFRLHRLMRRYRALLDPAAPELAADLDFRSVADFARLYFGQSAFERWIAPAITSTTQGDEHELSRVAFLLQFLELGEGREPWALPRCGLFELAAAAGERIEARCGVEVDRIEEGSDGGFVVHCHEGPGFAVGQESASRHSGREDGAARETLHADAVVVATGGAEAGRVAVALLTPAERDFFDGVRYEPSAVLVAALDEPAVGLPQLVRIPHVEGSPIEAYLVEPGLAEGRAPAGRGLLTLSATRQFSQSRASASDDVVEKELVAALGALLPRVQGSLRLTRFERRQDAVPSFEVGAYRALARMQRVQLDRRSLGRRLYFAGDYLAGPRLEHALVSGDRAAAALAKDL